MDDRVLRPADAGPSDVTTASAPAPKGNLPAELDEAEKRRRSFERSLAGPSVGKAGLIRDQTEINRVIAEASKGSKFYENQVRKDKELTEKIAWFRAKRDELMMEADVDRLAVEAERIMMEVEATRDLTQTIVHVDMDAFYAAVEVRRDPTLAGKPFGVGKGVLTTASYEARKFGCRSGMAGFIAKKLCPHIILTDMHFDLYIEASEKVRGVLRGYDENLMMASLDEGYLNITNYMKTHDLSASAVVSQIRAQVQAATELTMSAGIGPNRMLAKICSDINKPNGQFELEFDRGVIQRFMRDLPVRKIPGFGRVTERCLEGLGVERCGQVKERAVELLAMDHWFGYRNLCKAYLGIADNTVAPGKREERKSVGVERTFRDKTQDEEILAELESIAEELEKDLKSTQYAGKTVTVKYKLHTYEVKTRALSSPKYLTTKAEILPIASELLKKELPLRVRLLGIRMSTLKDLTVEDKGIKQFLKRTSREATAEKVVEDTSDFETVAAARAGTGPANKVEHAVPATASQTVEELEEAEQVEQCPICFKALPASNRLMNEHVDRCLAKVGVGLDGEHESDERERGWRAGEVEEDDDEIVIERVRKRVKGKGESEEGRGNGSASRGKSSIVNGAGGGNSKGGGKGSAKSPALGKGKQGAGKGKNAVKGGLMDWLKPPGR